MHDLQRTIVAIATPPGRGGIGCVRISGPAALDVAASVFRPARSGPAGAEALPPARVRFGTFHAGNGVMDHGFALHLPPTLSYTGEPTVELFPHGSPPVLAALVEAAIAAGCEPAGAGEFTYRALRHGRLDLARAEAVRDLVAARTLFQARVAFAQAEGALSRRLAPLRDALEDVLARGEAAIEFVDEPETELADRRLLEAVEEVLASCDALLAQHRAGRVVREGATVVITGRPNAGKSSLFNALLGRPRAIVHPSPGTTRDVLEETLELGGVPVRLLDTAGLRATDEDVEREGVQRARLARADADLVIAAVDVSREPDAWDLEAAGRGELVVLTKSDLPPHPRAARLAGLGVSALHGSGIADLRTGIRERLLGPDAPEHPVLTDARHAEALRRAREALARAVAAGRDGVSAELLLEDVRDALVSLGEISGAWEPERLYDRIFSTFCIGK